MKHIITQTLEEVVKGTVNHPLYCEIDERLENKRLTITCIPALADFGLIVGSRGRQIKAYQAIARAAGVRHGLDADFRMEKRFTGPMEHNGSFVADHKFNAEAAASVLTRICKLMLDDFSIEVTKDHSGRLFFEVDAQKQHAAAIQAAGDIFYPYCYQKGAKVKVLTGYE